MDLIKKKEKLYLVAVVKEGDEEKTSKSEREKLEKEDRPIDTAATLDNEIKSMKAEYLDIAGKRGFFYKIQAELEFKSISRHPNWVRLGYVDQLWELHRTQLE